MSLHALLRDHFGGVDGTRHAGQEPAFDPQEFYDGSIKVWGLIQSRGGSVQLRFDADMRGSWHGDRCTLEETFNYLDSGRVQHRTWNISKLADGSFTATADDIIGRAAGAVFGSAMRWQYEMAVPVGDRTQRLHFEDWAWAMPSGAAINRSYLRKFGVTVAELTAFMQKQ